MPPQLKSCVVLSYVTTLNLKIPTFLTAQKIFFVNIMSLNLIGPLI